ncbi:unnamed protein product [Ostreobium quekettii]|uniref:UDP-N-acetylglucosamine--dolichyl-phosphate N-acetylglucosaminephosphotransferase n=1 Tax=Ostreobium quekettii TaxID=121088 RepID=A0A8S1IMU9_9CHLO|nr:unnamed protein product [Ostreobium quekettii]|eukprot:evm.model.scf_3073.2 EVM.evm.TU.scf_3073.2   scf_3073:5137-6992(+)
MTRRGYTLFALALVGTFPCVFAFLNLDDGWAKRSLLVSALISWSGFAATRWLVPIAKAYTLRAGLFGYDINKKGTEAGEVRVPEALGLASGVVYLVCIVFIQQLHHYDHALGAGIMPKGRDWRSDYNAALATICFMLFLGFADDVLDIRWRVKLVLPAIAALPLVVAYSGGTSVVIPKPLRGVMGLPDFLDLGFLYTVYMILLTIFCTNSINILAGVNGLEVGQTFIISCAVLFHNIMELSVPDASANKAAAGAMANGHLFSAFLMLPLATTSFALLGFNWYPAQVFVGDTYTYFAGMAIAVAGILGHYSETLLIFLLPQLINFVYSLPQLLKIVPCPRHRLPRLDPRTGLLHATPNWNLINLVLHLMGPCGEEALCVRVLVMQVACCAVGFGAKWALQGVFHD